MVPKTKIEVRLTDDQRETLERLVQTGSHPATTSASSQLSSASATRAPSAA